MTSRRLIALQALVAFDKATDERKGRLNNVVYLDREVAKAYANLAAALDALYGPLPPPTVLEEAVRQRYEREGDDDEG